MIKNRRWLQFSLRAFVSLLTIGCLLLGWRVEQARRRGQAIDAIVKAGGFVGYGDTGDSPFLSRDKAIDHFWLDPKGAPVKIAIMTPLNASLGPQLSLVDHIGNLEIATALTEKEMRYLEGIQCKCEIRFYNTYGIPQTVFEELQRKLPNAKVVWGNQ